MFLFADRTRNLNHSVIIDMKIASGICICMR